MSQSFYSGIFSPQAALLAAPYKSDFLKSLSKGQVVTEEECLACLRLFLVNYTATVDAIYDMYTRLNAELDYTVWVRGGNPPMEQTGLGGTLLRFLLALQVIWLSQVMERSNIIKQPFFCCERLA